MQFTQILLASFVVVLQLAAAAPVTEKEVLILHEVPDAPAVKVRSPEAEAEALAEPNPYLICNNC
jgi:hypothetical protein